MIKEISQFDKLSLLKLQKEYAAYLTKNDKTIMAKIYGLFSIKFTGVEKVSFIMMKNLDYIEKDKIIFKYDLKFS